MDTFFPKTRRPTPIATSNKLKRPPPSITPPKAAKIPATPSTPKDARISRPAAPPPLKTKAKQVDERKAIHRLLKPPVNRPLFLDISDEEDHDKHREGEGDKSEDNINDKVNTKKDYKADKVTSGPLKGISTSLLEHIRSKEAAAKAVTPEQERTRRLLGIAPEVVRIVSTIFTANKKEVMPHTKIVEKCFKGLKSNYTTETITECLKMMDKVAPEWTSTVSISRGVFMRINRDKYTIPQLLEAIRRYKRENSI